MRWRVFGIVSLGVNILLLAVVLAGLHRINFRPQRATPALSSASNSLASPKIVVRRQLFRWTEVESPDYPTYIANLRDIGCPEQTIRDIIIADVNSLFARRRANELVTSEQQWWKSEPDTNVLAAAAEKSRALEDERRVLLTKLLGTNWEAGDIASLPRPTRAGMILDGPILGQLSPDTKEAVLDVSLRSQDHLQAYLDAQHAAGKNPDPAEVARLRRETRTELSKVLTAPQLEEFLLRYSQNASDLRASFGTLEYFDASPEEFRAVFRATDQIDEQLQALGDAADANSAQQRKNLLAQRENEIKNALGASRYEDYSMLQDPLYRQAVAQADAAGTPDAVRAIYQVNLAALAEADSITNDANLSTQQKDVAMKNLQLQQAQANTLAVGQDLPLDQTTPPQQPPRRLHQLRPGDSASVVALMYGLPVSALRAANPNVDFNRLRAGDSIVIPPSPLTSGP